MQAAPSSRYAVLLAAVVLTGCVSRLSDPRVRRPVHPRRDASAGAVDVGDAAAAVDVPVAADDAGVDVGVDAEAVDAGVCDPDAAYEQMPRPNAGLSEAPGDAGCLPGMVRIGDLCIDRYEAALVEVFDDGTQRSWSPFFNPGTRRVRAVSIAGAIPQGYITGDQAEAACERSGKRLCTDSEWLRACQGPAGTTFPYGNTRQPGVCNDARAVHPAIEYFGTSAAWIWSHLGNACISQQPDTVDPAGANPGCVSADGVYDMMGNLHEWTADPDGTFRGGFYVDTERNGPGCLYQTTAHNRQHWDYSTGFRCCADVQP